MVVYQGLSALSWYPSVLQTAEFPDGPFSSSSDYVDFLRVSTGIPPLPVRHRPQAHRLLPGGEEFDVQVRHESGSRDRIGYC